MTDNQLKDIIKNCVKSLKLNEAFLGLTREELNDVLHLRYINGVGTLERLDFTKKLRLEIYNFVLRKCRWILDFQHPSERQGGHWEAPFTHFFQSEAEGNESWLSDFQDAVKQQFDSFEHWINHDAKPNDPPHWVERYNLAQQIAKKYPTFAQDLKNLFEYISLQRHKEPTVPTNQENYPLYVSLYSESREYGGPEDGGWHYNHMQYIESIKVNSYKEARTASLKLLRDMTRGFTGTSIYLEKTPRCLETRERPRYA